MVEEADLFSAVAAAALDRLHFDRGTGDDKNATCTQACYECILSYSNQQDHRLLDRHLVRDLLLELAASMATKRHGGRDYEARYQWLKNLTDSRSELERRFIEHLYKTRCDLPDEAQKALTEVNTIPDFSITRASTPASSAMGQSMMIPRKKRKVSQCAVSSATMNTA